MQDVREEEVITTKSGLKYADVRIGGGTPVNQGMLVILDYRYIPFSCQTAPNCYTQLLRQSAQYGDRKSRGYFVATISLD